MSIPISAMESSQKSNGKIHVKSSSIHGTGLFAKEFIAQGEVVIVWADTKEISREEFAKLPDSEKHYIDIQDGKIFLVGKPERYVNHSCSSNTIPGYLCDLAARDIFPGEEITADYSHFFIPSRQFQCFCKSAACRGLVQGRNSE